ncbi:unnamed protein product [Adineta ricciae]|uniref:Right handed beta helix domain-containing protein n=1 Tax=Adineta ricciae TaxID=249248 RepID=A0A815LY75_ADIRI|nr:unnamed protein product [Adineta ricciae]
MYQQVFHYLVLNLLLVRVASGAERDIQQRASQTRRQLFVDQRGGATYKTIVAAASAAGPGDTIILAIGSGPYRETLNIRKNGTAAAPIIVEGHGETITGFDLMRFTFDGKAWIHTLPKLFEEDPVVIAKDGRRILQNQTTGQFLGPVKLREDGKTFELALGTSTDGWEISARWFVVAITSTSHHVYRNIVATGALNDGFNLHGYGTDLVFENITGYNNLDEGFSSHDTISSTIRTGRFWANDNGIANVNDCITNISNVIIYDNVGYGLFLNANTSSNLIDVSVWNNGATQIRFDNSAAGTATRVSVWKPSWNSPPWRRYRESKLITSSAPLGNNAARIPIPFWTGTIQTMATPIPDF